MDVHRSIDGSPYDSCWMSTEVLMDVLMKADGRTEVKYSLGFFFQRPAHLYGEGDTMKRNKTLHFAAKFQSERISGG